jgi:hypothetical protein
VERRLIDEKGQRQIVLGSGAITRDLIALAHRRGLRAGYSNAGGLGVNPNWVRGERNVLGFYRLVHGLPPLRRLPLANGGDHQRTPRGAGEAVSQGKQPESALRINDVESGQERREPFPRSRRQDLKRLLLAGALFWLGLSGVAASLHAAEDAGVISLGGQRGPR